MVIVSGFSLCFGLISIALHMIYFIRFLCSLACFIFLFSFLQMKVGILSIKSSKTLFFILDYDGIP